MSEWIELFADALSVHMTCVVIDEFFEERIMVIAIPARMSDRLQPRDVSVFRPLKTYVHLFVKNITESQIWQHSNQIQASSLGI